ncbi:MAG: 16S rRNA (adenine(1518)-N(6)/adenine(1519)-N(6))-dimethyltransferase RsmA [Candidatus Sumerlaeia bacterium]
MVARRLKKPKPPSRKGPRTKTGAKNSAKAGAPFRKEAPKAPARPRPPKKMSRISRQLSEAGLRLKKGLGQNFLVSQPHLKKIAESVGAHEDSLVLEIGCGLGNLTELLAQDAGSVLAIELDERFRSVHDQALAPLKNIAIIYGDFMEIDLPAILKKERRDADIRVVGNIPYHLTSPILFKLIATPLDFDCICLLMQQEVAVRLAAKPGSRHYGILAVKAGTRFKIENALTVPAGAFLPPPKIKSALARLTPREGGDLIPDARERQFFFHFVDQAFAQRRKMLPKSVSAASKGMIPREQVEAAMKAMGLETNLRAEQLSVEQFIELFQRLGKPELPAIRKDYSPTPE